MLYKYFQKDNPAWPKKLRDVVGRRVRLKNDMKTKGGRLFPAGTEMFVVHAYRGGLSLDFKSSSPFAPIRAVEPRDVDLLA